MGGVMFPSSLLSLLLFLLLGGGEKGALCDVLRIKNADEFVEFAGSGSSYVGGTVFLDNDIDFDGRTIEPIDSFSGNFNGQGHTISNLNISSSSTFVGLFGYSSATTIRNIVMDSSCLIEGYSSSYLGGFVGSIPSGGIYSLIEGCVNMANVSFQGNKASTLSIGGIIGYISSSYDVIMLNCANYGDIAVLGYARAAINAGGIVGSYSDNSNPVHRIVNCINYGAIDVSGSSSSNNKIGGVAGNTCIAIIENCLIAGKINSITGYIGGILGYSSSGTNITHCHWSNEVSKSCGSGSSTITNSSSVTSPKDALEDLNAQVPPNGGLNKWGFCEGNVRFIADSDSDSSKGVSFSSEMFIFPAPTREEHRFLGWFTGKDGSGEKVDETTVFTSTSDVTVYAHFAINQYVVTFMNGDAVIKSDKLDYGSTIAYPSTPSKAGHTFAGWDSEVQTVPGRNITIRATFTINNYTVTFDFNNGASPEVRVLPFNSSIVYPDIPEKEGFTFNGWDMLIDVMPAEDITITAQWTINNYTVTFDANGGDELPTPTRKVTFNTTYGELPIPTREEHRFLGWFTGKDGSGEKVDETTVLTSTSDVTVYAHWAINQYVVTFMNGEDVIKSDKLDYGSTIAYPSTPSKAGHTFAGWDSEVQTVPGHDLTIRATFTINNYTVTFDFNNGTSPEVRVLPFNSSIVYPDIPEKEGFTFNGWDMLIDVMPAEDITITANWTDKVTNYVEIVLGKKDMSEEEVKEIIEKFVDERDFVIEELRTDESTGETRVIIKFASPTEAQKFIRDVNYEKGSGEDFIRRLSGTDYSSFAPAFSPALLLGFIV